MAERGVEDRGEHEPDARVGEAPLHAGGVEIDLHAEGLQQVGGATPAGRGAIAVLGDRHPGARHHDRGDRGDVEGAASIPAGPARVEHGCGWRHGFGEREDGAGEAVELVGGLPLRPQRHQEAPDLTRGDVAGHDRAHRPGRFVDRKRLVGNQPLEGSRPEGQNASFPSSKRGFDSPHPLFRFRLLRALHREIDDAPAWEPEGLGEALREPTDALQEIHADGLRQRCHITRRRVEIGEAR